LITFDKFIWVLFFCVTLYNMHNRKQPWCSRALGVWSGHSVGANAMSLGWCRDECKTLKSSVQFSLFMHPDQAQNTSPLKNKDFSRNYGHRCQRPINALRILLQDGKCCSVVVIISIEWESAEAKVTICGEVYTSKGIKTGNFLLEIGTKNQISRKLEVSSSILINWFSSCNDSLFSGMTLTLHKSQVHCSSVMQ